jgi:hypothetical protein
MARRRRALAAVNTEGWMMSYADMATILLAMFIVLSTLGKDQTGASLQKGLESWRESRQMFGLDGFFNTSNQPNRFNTAAPRYMLDPDAEEGEGGVGIAGEKSKGDKQFGRSIDQEEERFQRFIKEMSRQFDVVKLPHAVGMATLDLFEPTRKQAPYWTPKQLEQLAPIVPLLRRGDYRLTVVVWAPMAKDSALQRSAEKARQLADELCESARLDAAARGRVSAVAQTWEFVDYQRPVVSLVLTRTKAAGARP